MKIDIWSDIRCPFCYIGKRKLEAGLEKFAHRDAVEIEWHSFELDPSLQTQPDKNAYDYLAEIKGQSREWSEQMHAQVKQTARQAGLDFNFETAVVANSFDAHRLIQLAKKHGLVDLAEESLFRAYFTEGKNISDHQVLADIGSAIGLNRAEVETALSGNQFTKEVREDEAAAQAIGIRGVPFFIFNEQYSISGAQPVEAFTQTLDAAWELYQANSLANKITPEISKIINASK